MNFDNITTSHIAEDTLELYSLRRIPEDAFPQLEKHRLIFHSGWQQQLARNHNRLGVVFEAQGKLTEAQAEFEAAVAITRRLTEQDPSHAGWEEDLVAHHRWLGIVFVAQGKMTEAKVALEAVLAIRSRLAEKQARESDSNVM